MADPLSVTASVLAVITAAVQSTRSLCETIKRFKDRNKTLRRLQDELEDLGKILDSLIHVINAEASILALLQGPIDRCSVPRVRTIDASLQQKIKYRLSRLDKDGVYERRHQRIHRRYRGV